MRDTTAKMIGETKIHTAVPVRRPSRDAVAQSKDEVLEIRQHSEGLPFINFGIFLMDYYRASLKTIPTQRRRRKNIQKAFES